MASRWSNGRFIPEMGLGFTVTDKNGSMTTKQMECLANVPPLAHQTLGELTQTRKCMRRLTGKIKGVF